MALKKTLLDDLNLNPFKTIGKDWMLITAGDQHVHNTMTASWGSLGVLWGKSVSTVHVRPQRYTYQLMESSDFYSLCFFDESYRDALNFCGSKSGRDCNKAKDCGLTPLFDLAAPYYAEASLVFICQKVYAQDIDAAHFIDDSFCPTFYPKKDFHRSYTGAIIDVLIKE